MISSAIGVIGGLVGLLTVNARGRFWWGLFTLACAFRLLQTSFRL